MANPQQRTPNPDQQAVIQELDRNIILFASAGTGKTFTVARRVQHILEAEKARPEEILCLTFTIKAAGEMKDDIFSYVGEAAKNVVISTIHSFAYSVLKEESVLHPETVSMPGVCDEADAAELLKNIAVEFGLPERSAIFHNPAQLYTFSGIMKQQRELMRCYSEDEARDFMTVFREIEKKQPELIQKMFTFYDPAAREELQDSAFIQLIQASAGRFMHRYVQSLRESSLLDFDDLICLTHKLFRDPEAASRWRARYRYITVDEMQDTSELEYDTLKALLAGNHVMMCGDFFQTIYQWRGSNPEKVLSEYVRGFNARRFMFARNYRSTRTLTAATFGYLRNTWPDLMGKYCPAEIITESETAGEPILSVRLRDQDAEALWIYNHLEHHAPEDPTKVCIMARGNRYIADLYTRLSKISSARKDGRELRFFTVDNDAKFYRRAVVKDILAFLRILVNPADALGFERIVEKYAAGIGRASIRKIQELRPLGISLASFVDEGLYRDGDPCARLISAWQSSNVVIYDTETTGLDLQKDQIIQISAIRLNAQGEIIDRMDQMVIPTVPITPGAQMTHHQTPETIRARGGIGIRPALEKFLAFTKGAVLVGHNSINFDSPLIRRQLRENSLPMPEIIAEFDTLPLSRQFLPKSVNYKLETLCQTFGITNMAAHDAMGDITATGEVLSHLIQTWLIPQTDARRAALAAWQPKFEKIYRFLQSLRAEYLEPGNIHGMIEAIIRKCSLRSRYPERISQLTLDDFLYAIAHAEIRDPVLYLRELLSDAALSGSQMDLLITKLHKIPIITVHQAKGCEFDMVIVAGADDDQFPTYNAKKHGTEVEEARVFYVAITRARYNLILTSVYQKVNRGGTWPVSQSRFINRIPRQFIRSQRQS